MTNERPPIIKIEAESISDAYLQILWNIHKEGVMHYPDYKGTPTKRVCALFHIKDIINNQINEHLCPFGNKTIDKYRDELTEEYADWYMSLADDDKKKFEYCYAKQLFRYGAEAYNTVKANIESLRVGSRRHVGVLWENETHIPKYQDQPCWIAYKLELLNETEAILYITYRSWDAFGGLPANLVGIVYGIQKAFKDANSDIKLTDIYANGYDVHMYNNDYENIKDKLLKYEECAKCRKPTLKSKMMPSTKGFICGCK
jgi:thymidylate synthase